MKTNFKFASVVKEKTIDYKSENSKNSICQIWVINADGGVLIRNSNNLNPETEAESLTIQSDCSEESFKMVESLTGILCSKDYLREAYSYVRNGKRISGYILATHLDESQKEVVEDRSEGVFIEYRELMSKLVGRNLSESCKESVLYLISTLYDKYNYL